MDSYSWQESAGCTRSYKDSTSGKLFSKTHSCFTSRPPVVALPRLRTPGGSAELPRMNRPQSLRAVIAFIFLFVAIGCGVAGELSKDETEKLLARAQLTKEAFDKGDAATITAMSHPSMFRFTNGKEGFEKLTRAGLEQIKASGTTLVKSSLGAPTGTYTSKTDTVCFIPRVSIYKVKGNKVKSTSFLLAARNPDSEWLFVDGAGLRKNPAMLKALFPHLPDDVQLPENKVEKID
jgi:hypothetical protein